METTQGEFARVELRLSIPPPNHGQSLSLIKEPARDYLQPGLAVDEVEGLSEEPIG